MFRLLRSVDRAYVLIASYALLLIVNGLVKLVWGVDVLTVAPPDALMDAVPASGVTMPSDTIFTIAAGMTVFVALTHGRRASWG